MSGFRQVRLSAERPILDSAIDHLLSAYGSAGELDLHRVVIVLPAAAAGRRLKQRLWLRCQEEGLRLRPPTVSTVGQLPELLYQPKRPFASESLQQLVWVDALRRMPEERIRDLFAARPDFDDFLAWLEIAQLVQGLHRELASETLSIQDVIRLGGDEVELSNGARWQALSELQAAYLSRLDELGYWDLQTARSFAIEHEECRTDRELVLLAAVDLTGSMRRMLDQVAERVVLLQVLPEGIASGMDEHGCLQPEVWSESRLDLSGVEVVIADGPDDQAVAALQRIEQWAPEVSIEDVTIGVPDESLVMSLRRQSLRWSLPLHDFAGQRIGDISIGHWLRTLLDWVETRSFRSLAALVRHPLVEERLSRELGSRGWLSELDRYHERHLPALMHRVEGAGSESVSAIVTCLAEWCQGVLGSDLRALGQWGTAWAECLGLVLGDDELDPEVSAERECLQALGRWRDAVSELESLPSEVQPQATASVAFRYLLRQVLSQRVSEPPQPDRLPMMGWLDLPFDDASHVVVVGFNEGRVPSSEATELFLSNQLRRRLRMMHRSRRLARDAYYLKLLIEGRKSLCLVAGRHTSSHDPLRPSRLLFHDSPEVLAGRALECFDQPPRRYQLQSGSEAEPSTWRYGLPRPSRPSADLRLSPTDFRKYLECPYRFYLRKFLGLQTRDDQASEMGPGEFGDLLHEALRQFGKSSQRDSERAEVIEAALLSELDAAVRKRFGSSHHPAVDLQVEHARRRLVDFAQHQARWAAEGWRIQDVEFSGATSLELGSVGEVEVKGRIDRIDYHAQRDEWALLDYKSSESGKGPEETHQDKQGWVDFQLPLYARMAEARPGMTGRLHVGYVVLSRDEVKNGFQLAGWSEAEISQAQDEAVGIARKIVAGEFWPPTEFDTRAAKYDDYAALMSLERSDESVSASVGE